VEKKKREIITFPLKLKGTKNYLNYSYKITICIFLFLHSVTCKRKYLIHNEQNQMQKYRSYLCIYFSPLILHFKKTLDKNIIYNSKAKILNSLSTLFASWKYLPLYSCL
jgi:hypothetical protein